MDALLLGPAAPASFGTARPLVSPAEDVASAPSWAQRCQLLGSVRTIAAQLKAGAAQSESAGRLADESVDALRAHGLWGMRLCRELGGLELPIVTQIEVLAALASVDASSAWCTMVANHGVAVLGATMPDAAVDRIFADGLPACSIVAAPCGAATRVEGGYLLNGTWRVASGVRNACWVHAVTFIDRDPSRPLPLAIPAGDVELLDSWDVVGLAATGSNDFTLTNYFLPEALAGREDDPYGQVRGTRRYDRAGVEHVESYEHLAFAIGVARRALDELRAALGGPLRGRTICDREVVQQEIGRAVVKLQAIETLAYALYARVDAATTGDAAALLPTDVHLPRALAALATELALECVQLAFRRSGLLALRKLNIFDRLLRDMSVAATHVMVDDQAFPSYAQFLIETGAPLDAVPARRSVAGAA